MEKDTLNPTVHFICRKLQESSEVPSISVGNDISRTQGGLGFGLSSPGIHSRLSTIHMPRSLRNVDSAFRQMAEDTDHQWQIVDRFINRPSRLLATHQFSSSCSA